MSADQPGLACIVGFHLFVDIHDEARSECVALEEDTCGGGVCLLAELCQPDATLT